MHISSPDTPTPAGTAPAELMHIALDDLLALSQRTLEHLGLSSAHAAAMARVIVAGQRDACQSHGLYRLVTCAHTVRAGKVQLQVAPVLTATGGPIVRVDAGGAFSPLAFEQGLPALVQATQQHGIGALVIHRCFHFSALWPEIEAVTEHGLVALALTPSHAWVAPTGGHRPVLGTNPIAFGWPRPGQNPYVFDLATSAIARGDLELHRRAGTPLPEGCGVDEHGQPSTDPAAVVRGAMLAFGGHKGSALSTMVELMAAALIGDFTSQESLQLDDGAGAAPCHGELILAFDPARFAQGGDGAGPARAEALFEAITRQGARLPSQRRFAARVHSLQHGATVTRALYEEILAMGKTTPTAP